MFSTLKKFAAFSIVCTVINAACTVMTFLLGRGYLADDYTILYAMCGLFGTATMLFLLISLALWSLHGDLDANNENTAEDISALKKRIAELEKKQALMEK